MGFPLTAEDLAYYRRARQESLRTGRRVSDVRFREVGAAIRSGAEQMPRYYRDVAVMYWLDGMTAVAISFRIHYSERHVRRIKRRAENYLLTG